MWDVASLRNGNLNRVVSPVGKIILLKTTPYSSSLYAHDWVQKWVESFISIKYINRNSVAFYPISATDQSFLYNKLQKSLLPH